MLEFAHRFPADTVGVVLVDAPHPDLGARLLALDVKTKIPEAQYWKLPNHIRREYEGTLAAKLAGDLGDIPLIVIVAGDTLSNERGPMIDKTESELAKLSTNGRRMVIEDSSHLMLRDAPDQVTACVLDVLRQARERLGK
jgi:pimeloyl-ACP methyl ester carboxylesterase